MKRRAVIEDAVGETRAAVYEGRKLVELHLDRWSTRAAPKLGERWTGQVVTVDNSVAGAFVSLGEGPDSLLQFRAQKDLPRLTDGLLVDVVITKEAMAEKGPLIRYAGEASAGKPGPVKRLDLRSRLGERFDGIAFGDAPVGIVDTATERTLALRGGGSLTLDQTQALLAVDIDKGAAPQLVELCLAAAETLMVQLRLRGLGGLVVADFPNLRQPRQRSTVTKRIEQLGEQDPANVRVAPFSRFGVLEMTRGQDGPSLDAKINDRFGEPTDETQALRALRRLEREGKASAGAQLSLVVPEPAWNWLESAPFDWRGELTGRIGARFTAAPGPRLEVSADR